MLVVLSDGEGQMCNKLLMHVNIIASSKFHNYKVVYYGYDEYEHIKKINYSGIIAKKKNMLCKLVSRILQKKIGKQIFSSFPFFIFGQDGENSKLDCAIASDAIIGGYKFFFTGYPFYDYEALRYEADFIRSTITPDEITANKLKQRFDAFKLNYEVIIGVHMRRKDYKIWRNGMYYYDDETYFKQIRYVSSIWPTKKILFILFSDEDIKLENFESDNIRIIKAQGTPVEDLFSLALCDYIMGPPSTFSGMASFLGKSPKYVILEKDSIPQKESFKVWIEETCCEIK